VASYPQFSWTDNALSDLGVIAGVASTLFSAGLIFSGVLALMFASGLFLFLRDNMLGEIGASLLIIDALALCAIGFFPENVKPIHYYASVAFFVLFQFAIIFVAATYLWMHKLKMGLFSFLAAVFAMIVWIIQFTVGFGEGVAIPETLTSLSVLTWTLVMGYNMFKQSSR
jgi:hypothetical membrane protein